MMSIVFLYCLSSLILCAYVGFRVVRNQMLEYEQRIMKEFERGYEAGIKEGFLINARCRKE